MHILILGAAGMVGRKLTERLLRDGRLGDREITRMTLHDVVAPTQARQRGDPDQRRHQRLRRCPARLRRWSRTGPT